VNIYSFGVDFKTAPIEILEACSCKKDDITYYLSNLVTSIFFDEMVIISTCNRTEWVFTCTEKNKAMDMLLQIIVKKTNISASILKKYIIIRDNEELIDHLMKTASGLNSMVIGENEILAQIKENYAFCMEFGATSAILNKLFQLVISTGKEVRSVTKIASGAQSISSIAIEAIRNYESQYN